MGNTAFEIEQRRNARLKREVEDSKAANDLAARIIAEINNTIIRPGPKPEERECTTVAQELEALQPRIATLILEG